MIRAILDGCYKINPTDVNDYIGIGGFAIKYMRGN